MSAINRQSQDLHVKSRHERVAEHRRGRRLIGAGVIAGSVGGLAMIPFGVMLRRGGYPVNVYGPLLLEVLVGRAPVWALVVEHFLISWALAVPLAALPTPLFHHSWPISLLVGFGYGALIWALVNSLVLPAVFGHSTPWQIGWPAIWPSVLVHLVYGVAATFSVRRWS